MCAIERREVLCALHEEYIDEVLDGSTTSPTYTQFGKIKRLAHLANQNVPWERFLQELTVRGEVLMLCLIKLRVASHEQDSDPGMEFGQAPCQRGSIEFRHDDVSQEKMDRSIERSGNFDRLDAVAGG